jgi:hypothetical protein
MTTPPAAGRRERRAPRRHRWTEDPEAEREAMLAALERLLLS